MLIVALWLVTVIVGVPVLTLSDREPPLPVARVQWWLGVASPKIRCPMVREPSSVTVALDVRSSVLKSAVTSMPLALTPANQLPAVGQLPPAGLSQVGEATTRALSVASSNRPVGSVTRTMKTLAPAVPAAGVPANDPLAATVSQAGPDTLENVRVSVASASVAVSKPASGVSCKRLALMGSMVNAGG